MVKYSFAKYREQVVHISEVTEQMRREDDFHNIVTGERMTAYLNGKFQKHFHHYTGTPHDNETYLHKAAKAIFGEAYSDCLKHSLPFFIDYLQAMECRQHYGRIGVACSLDDKLCRFDLTKIFKEIRVEEKFDELKPDIQLVAPNGKDVIFVEIKVTHASTQKKIDKGKRIIEIAIRSEQDVLRLRQREISPLYDNVTFHNFIKQKEIVNYCSHQEKGCGLYWECFVLYKDGSYEFLRGRLENVLSHLDTHEYKIKYIDHKPFGNPHAIYDATRTQERYYIERKLIENVGIKDCRYCKYVGDKTFRGKKVGLFCKFLKKEVFYPVAWKCPYFRVKEEII